MADCGPVVLRQASDEGRGESVTDGQGHPQTVQDILDQRRFGKLQQFRQLTMETIIMLPILSQLADFCEGGAASPWFWEASPKGGYPSPGGYPSGMNDCEQCHDHCAMEGGDESCHMGCEGGICGHGDYPPECSLANWHAAQNNIYS